MKPAHIVSAGTRSYVGGAVIPDKLVTRDVKTAASQQRRLQLDLSESFSGKMETLVALLGSLVLLWSCGATLINKPCPSNNCPAYRLKEDNEVGSSPPLCCAHMKTTQTLLLLSPAGFSDAFVS